MIQVQDSGRGISSEDQDQALSAVFATGEAQSSPPTAGTGLGLHLSKSLAEHMGGTLECESAPGVGSTFTLRIIQR